ncbi:MAG: SOSS complex subunit B family protein [Nanoarchaeota archaeon]
MEIKDLHARQGNVDLTAEVADKSASRTFDKFGKQGRVCNAKIKDGSGVTITLTLWNDEVDLVNIGDKIKITNGYVGEWQGELQLSAGKFGKIEVVEKGAGAPPKVYTNVPQASGPEEKEQEIEDQESEDEVEEEYF